MSSDNFANWTRNVQDHFKNNSVEEIRDVLQENKLPLSVLMSQLEGDFNFGSVIRSCNSFNINKVFYFGKKRFDKRGALGTYHYIDVTYLSSFDDVSSLKKEYKFVALENNIEKQVNNITNFIWPENPLVIVGEENIGVSEDILGISDYFIEIPSRGSVRSLNAGAATSIAIYDYFLKSKYS